MLNPRDKSGFASEAFFLNEHVHATAPERSYGAPEAWTTWTGIVTSEPHAHSSVSDGRSSGPVPSGTTSLCLARIMSAPYGKRTARMIWPGPPGDPFELPDAVPPAPPATVIVPFSMSCEHTRTT